MESNSLIVCRFGITEKWGWVTPLGSLAALVKPCLGQCQQFWNVYFMSDVKGWGKMIDCRWCMGMEDMVLWIVDERFAVDIAENSGGGGSARGSSVGEALPAVPALGEAFPGEAGSAGGRRTGVNPPVGPSEGSTGGRNVANSGTRPRVDREYSLLYFVSIYLFQFLLHGSTSFHSLLSNSTLQHFYTTFLYCRLFICMYIYL